MRNEVLRMERVTYKEDEVVKLKDFNLQIFQGEVMGFLPVNSHGKTALLKLLERNLPLYDGYIYYGGEKVIPGKNIIRLQTGSALSRRKVLWQGI